MVKTPPPPPLMDVRLEHLLLFLFAAFLVYHFFLRGCIDGFSIGGEECADGVTTCINKCNCNTHVGTGGIINYMCDCPNDHAPTQSECKGELVNKCESHPISGPNCDDQYQNYDGKYYQCNHNDWLCNFQTNQTPCYKVK